MIVHTRLAWDIHMLLLQSEKSIVVTSELISSQFCTEIDQMIMSLLAI